MQKTTILKQKSFLARTFAAVSAIALCAGLASCSGNADNTNGAADENAQKAGMQLLEGISASGKLGQKPDVKLQTPLKVKRNTYAILQRGNGPTIEEGDRVCSQGIVFNAKDGKELMNTWDKGNIDCSISIGKNVTSRPYYALIKGKKVNTTIAFGVSGKTGPSYVMVLTLISRAKALTRATGKAVTDIPANLPKVTLDKSGVPSLDKNNYVPDGKLVSQTLIEGTGKKVTAKSTVTAHYAGWTTDKDGKLHQFDSSWLRGMPADFSLAGQVIQGWTKGLTGKKVGSQVLLVIPPNDGYGSEDKKDAKGNVTIPANSTLYFVVDILYASKAQ
ncbi:FKBP-type peptidyl-prolyl cis-trans isomerase [Gardnerella sp. KA00747]|uniref:FKBP-type peptidyl-prolyl cis-trans isomerase n=1 Tax=Gardnerella sp. KA00747 TaxID=2749078 RepID=UPI003BAD31B6